MVVLVRIGQRLEIVSDEGIPETAEFFVDNFWEDEVAPSQVRFFMCLCRVLRVFLFFCARLDAFFGGGGGGCGMCASNRCVRAPVRFLYVY